LLTDYCWEQERQKRQAKLGTEHILRLDRWGL